MAAIVRPAVMCLAIPLAIAMLGLPVRSTHAAVSVCDAVDGNLVTNCGFEGGTYISTVGGFTNGDVPNGWTPSASFDSEPSFNFVTTSRVNSGDYALSIGNFDGESAPVLSQVLTDTPGDLESGSLFVQYGAGQGSDPNAFFDVQINGINVLALDDTIPNGFAEYAFSFIGTGSDTLSLTANTNPNEWVVDDVVVTESVAEPPAVAVLALAIVAMCAARRRSPAGHRARWSRAMTTG